MRSKIEIAHDIGMNYKFHFLPRKFGPVSPDSAIPKILIAINSITIKDNLACRV